MIAYLDPLNTADFATIDAAELALIDEGFTTRPPDVYGLWHSRDGRVDAVIKQRFRDDRFYIVLFA